MRRSESWSTARAWLLLCVATLMAVFVAVPSAQAQDVDEVTQALERQGYYIEPGAEGTTSGFADLVRQSESSADRWYFVSMAESVPDSFADDIFDRVAPRGNVLVYFLDGDFANVQLATEYSESVENAALSPFDGNWNIPEDFMSDVVVELDRATGSSSSGSSSSGSSSSSGGGFPWLLVAIPVLLIGGFWFMSRRGKKKQAEDDLDTATKIRAEIQTELEELANDVIVLGGPTDLTDKTQAIEYYREATDAYLEISDELPDVDKLEDASLKELSELGARISHARWQMDAAEAIIDGEPLPEKPKVPPPPAPKPVPAEQREQRRRQIPQRQPRPRVPYSQSRRRSGGGLLDILIAGAGMMGGRSRRGGGMFGGSSRSRGRTSSRGGGMFGGGSTQSAPRRGGGVFGSGSRSRPSTRTSRSRPTSRSRSRSSTRSSGRRSTSRRRRR